MDRLRSAATRHGQTIKDTFPKEVPKRSQSSTRMLAEIYEWECVRRGDERSPPSRVNQLESLEEHVTTCVQLWHVLKNNSLCAKKSVEQHYLDFKIAKSFALRPHSLDLWAQRDEHDALIIHAQTRALARVWRNLLPLSKVDELCRNEDEERTLLISCAAAKLKPYQQTFLWVLPTTHQIGFNKLTQRLLALMSISKRHCV